MSRNAQLVLIPTPIGDKKPIEHFSPSDLLIIYQIKHFLVENLRTSRRFLKAIQYPHDFEQVWFYELNEHNHLNVTDDWLLHINNGYSVGLMSEAGIPCVADPGYMIVRQAHMHQITVQPVSGTSSIMLALMASGLNGQQFTFHGYLPIKTELLKNKLKKMEIDARNGYSQIFIETPYRNNRMIETICNYCPGDLLLCIASGLETEKEKIQTKKINDWKKNKPDLKGVPSVFILGY